MNFKIQLTATAETHLAKLEGSSYLRKQHKAVLKALDLLVQNPRHPGLQTHKFSSLRGKNGEEIFEAYAENRTPGAYRIFFYYGPDKNVITITAIVSHP